MNQLKLPIKDYAEEHLKEAAAERLGIKKESIKSIQIIRRSLDARKKDDLKYIYILDVEVVDEAKVLKRHKSTEIMHSAITEYQYSITGTNKSLHRPIVIGSGPAGLFCAYFLSLSGYRPIVIERGEPIEDRVKTIQEFWDTGLLNEESNVQFGEGGAGTFSDGKLNTLVKDKYGRIRRVLEIFVEHGAPSDVLYLNKPHIGTDYLRKVIKNMRNHMIELGGEIRFNTKLTDVVIEKNRLVQAVFQHHGKEDCMDCDQLILAIGHSARDTFSMLYDRGVQMEQKAFAAGVRIEHEQEFISKLQYGALSHLLSPADYKLTHQCKNGRGVYTFCMCPGGFVVNASSESNRLTVNGMSNYKRDEQNANSAVIVTVTPEDFKKEIDASLSDSPLAGIYFQRKYEEAAYLAAQGMVPIQLFGDLLRNKKSDTMGHIIPNIKGRYQCADLRMCLPDYIIDSLIEGILAFDQKMKGFADEEAVLSGVEMRTSSPLRILRNQELICNVDGIYPCGEGAGYAGGIISAAVDGMKVFESYCVKYKP